MTRSLTAVAWTALWSLAACGGAEPGDGDVPADTAEVARAAEERAGADVRSEPATYHASDFAFQGPGRLPAGATTFRITNSGSVVHHVQLVRIDGDHSAADLRAELTGKGPAPHFPAWAVPAGGVNAVEPGGEATATAVLAPGRYAAVCMIPIPDGVPHAARGMVAEIEVTEDGAGAASLPAADVTLQLREYAFQVSGTIESGGQTLRVTNAGREPHEVQLFRMDPGKRLADLMEWARGGFQGPPPAEPLGGVPAIAPGDEATFSADFEPGVYALICFVPKAEGAPGPADALHVHLGMATEIEVS